VRDVFDHPVMARCQLHKIRNVKDHVPQRMRTGVERRMRAAYHADSALDAEAQLTVLARELDKTHPSAAASLREGMAETLTVLALDVPPTLARTLRSTNAIWVFVFKCRSRRCFPDRCSPWVALTLNAIDAERLSWIRSVGLAA
jgi:transposase-like protein